MFTTPYGTRLIGQTEKTLNAILRHLLSGSGVTEPEWVALSVTVQQGATPTTTAPDRIAATLKVSPQGGAAVLTSLIDGGLAQLSESGQVIVPSPAGLELHGRIRRQVDEITERLWGDIPAGERETAASVLHTTLVRATAELATLTS